MNWQLEMNEDAVETLEAVRKDAARYRWLRDTLHGAKAGGFVNVNDHLSVYEECEPGEEVRIQWYPETPVGFYCVEAGTLDAAVDEAMKGNTE
jgi:hypothetical protein